MNRLLHILPHPGGGGEALVEVLEAAGGFEHRRTYLTDERSLLPAARSIAAGRRGLAREVERADLLHVLGDTSACLMARLIARRPTVIGTHGLHLLRRARGPAGAVVRRALRLAVANSAVTVCPSEPELAELRAVCSAKEGGRLRLVLNGIRLPEPIAPRERESARRDLRLSERAFVALYAGQLEPRKRTQVAAEAVRALGDGAVLLVAGDGPLREALDRLAGPEVRVLGFRSDVDRLLAASDVFVMPSEREGLSLAVLEAMGRGLPVVVSDGTGNPEAVGDAGIVVPLGDVSALAAALRRLACSPRLREQLGVAARERVHERFTLDRWLAEMQGELDRALGTSSATAPGRAAGGRTA